VYALDTNSLSYFLKGRGRVGERLLAQPPAKVGLPSVVLYELAYGAARSQAPPDLKARLETLLRSLPILPFGEAEARAAARIRADLETAGKPISEPRPPAGPARRSRPRWSRACPCSS